MYLNEISVLEKAKKNSFNFFEYYDLAIYIVDVSKITRHLDIQNNYKIS